MFLTDKSSGLNLIILAPAALVNSREKLWTDGRLTLKLGDNGFLIEFSRCRLHQLTFFSSTQNRAFQFCMNKSRCDSDLIICFHITIFSILILQRTFCWQMLYFHSFLIIWEKGEKRDRLSSGKRRN